MSPTALLLIDVINPLQFDGGEELLPHALRAARAIAALRRRARVAGVPTIYVNDNFDRWHLGFRELVDSFRGEQVRGLPVIDLLAPDERADHFILKPKHSGFYCTGLDVLLEHLGARTLILTGIAGNICVLFTANDAHMRDYSLVVPADCVASQTAADNDFALRQMQLTLKADVRASTELNLFALRHAQVEAHDEHSHRHAAQR